MLSNKHVSLCIGAGLALVFLASLPESWRAIGEIKKRQIIANSQLVEWKTSYEALLPVNDIFRESYPSGDDAKDLVALYRLLNVEKHQLNADVDKVRQTLASVVEVNGMAIGLQRLCLSNGADSMTVSADSIRNLRLGLRALSKRQDVDMGTVSIEIKEGKAVAQIMGMCLKVRTERDAPGEGPV
jgi:hypothetical protein